MLFINLYRSKSSIDIKLALFTVNLLQKYQNKSLIIDKKILFVVVVVVVIWIPSDVVLNFKYSKTSLRRWPTRRSPMVKIRVKILDRKSCKRNKCSSSGLLTRPEYIVSVLELVDGVGICHCNWQGVPLVDYPVGECVCPL
ncbi:hypothetical protein BpHYR1_021005 [Brachionus plicatilis]|uniref:Uncharacterized protein n=1 Tax=Brachionus plicatilis TaxID=10195 RepID=A0A3M7T0I4_BRAPC|nr:hypothetical protein BpHYR1_021005 [Brachionus plicatilis]